MGIRLYLLRHARATTAKLKDLIDNVNKIDEKRFQEEDLIDAYTNISCRSCGLRH